jgi:cell wall assembly regulator SMI1
VIGQVIRFLYDPDEYRVIAAGFDDYLQLQIQQEYVFVDPDQ